MEYNITVNDEEHNFSNDNSQEISERAEIKKKISFEDSDEKNFGRLEEYFEYLNIYDNPLKSNLEETNFNTT